MSSAGGRKTSSRTATLGLVLAILLSPGSVSAQSSLGPLAPYIEPSQGDIWTVDVDDSAVLMSKRAACCLILASGAPLQRMCGITLSIRFSAVRQKAPSCSG
jgi:hypothetical protein